MILTSCCMFLKNCFLAFRSLCNLLSSPRLISPYSLLAPESFANFCLLFSSCSLETPRLKSTEAEDPFWPAIAVDEALVWLFLPNRPKFEALLSFRCLRWGGLYLEVLFGPVSLISPIRSFVWFVFVVFTFVICEFFGKNPHFLECVLQLKNYNKKR